MATSKAPKMALGKVGQKEYPSENTHTYLGFLVQGMYHQWRMYNCCQNK
jgi:hypothetical protein